MPRSLTIIVLLIAVIASAAAAAGIFSGGGPGPTTHMTFRGEITLYGHGLYRHMSKDVAPQGIAQDVVTLVVAVPMLLIALWHARGGTIRAQLLLAGVLFYFFVTYLFYLAMAAYNAMFLAYVALLGLSAFGVGLTLATLTPQNVAGAFRTVPRGAGTFLIVTSLMIASLWLGIVVPPLVDGSIIPPEVEHSTTLIVQGFDLALLLPLAFVAGVQLRRGRPFGLYVVPPYLVFLSLLMTALTAKVIAMGLLGQNVIPVIVIIPVTNLLAIFFTWRTLAQLRA